MSNIGFGTWSWGNKLLWGYRQEEDDSLLEKTFHEAINSGLNFIDTADSYGIGHLNGRSEKLLGHFLQSLPYSLSKNITVATKLAPYPWRIGRQGFKSAFQASKARLQGKLDRVQLHWSTSRYAPWQEVQLMDGLCDLVDNKLISEIGVSNMGPKRLISFHERLQMRGIPLKSIQIQFSLLSPKPNKFVEVQKVCKELNIEILAYSPLALGVLAIPPKIKELPTNNTFLRRNLFTNLLPASIELRRELNKIAMYREVSQAQVSLNWCRAHGAIPIVGLRKPTHAKEAAEASKWSLTSKEKETLDILSQKTKIRMPNNPFQSD